MSLAARRYNNRLSIADKYRIWLLPLAASVVLMAIACQPEPSPPKPKALTASEVHGERLYKASCAACHHADSTAPLNGPGLQGVFKAHYLPSGAPANDERVHEVIVRGRRNMPGFGQILDDAQVRDIIAYLRTL
jgi:mono/diheme cytochrome c family protein